MIEEYNNVYSLLEKKIEELLIQGKKVKSTNTVNTQTMKQELIELPHQFFRINNPQQIIFNLDSYKTHGWWLVGELLTEFLNLNPPVMSKYGEVIEEMYKLTPQGTCEYLYGNRWFENNQLENVKKKLLKNPNTKRALITTFVPHDLEENREDIPCNVNYMFLCRDNRLSMTTTIRSSDIMRGLKYDFPLASFMQQSLASWCNMDIGEMYFLINSMHVYKKDYNNLEKILEELPNNKKQPISMIIPKGISDEIYWNDIRHIKKVEESSYNNNFIYAEKNINDIYIPIFRDFARIFAIKNAKHKERNDLIFKYKERLENSEMRRWNNL